MLKFFEILVANGGQILGKNRVIGQRNAITMCPKYRI